MVLQRLSSHEKLLTSSLQQLSLVLLMLVLWWTTVHWQSSQLKTSTQLLLIIWSALSLMRTVPCQIRSGQWQWQGRSMGFLWPCWRVSANKWRVTSSLWTASEFAGISVPINNNNLLMYSGVLWLLHAYCVLWTIIHVGEMHASIFFHGCTLAAQIKSLYK